MVAHGNKEVKEQFAALLHLGLHGATPLEGTTAADDQGEVVGTKLGVRVRSVRVGPASRREDSGDLDARL